MDRIKFMCTEVFNNFCLPECSCTSSDVVARSRRSDSEELCELKRSAKK